MRGGGVWFFEGRGRGPGVSRGRTLGEKSLEVRGVEGGVVWVGDVVVEEVDARR